MIEIRGCCTQTFQKVKMYDIPDQIFDQYNRAQVSTSMGLFAELNLVSLAPDSLN
jgi:nuclear pore complex protein Nup155